MKYDCTVRLLPTVLSHRAEEGLHKQQHSHWRIMVLQTIEAKLGRTIPTFLLKYPEDAKLLG